MNLSDLLADEPAYVLDPSAVVRAGRRRRARGLALLSGTAALAVTGTALALTWDRTVPSSTLQPAAAPPAAGPDDRWTALVRQHSPAGWTIDEVKSTDDGWAGHVDDGRGPGRLSFGLSPHPGSLQQHPCSDPEFVAGGKCEESELAGGRRLVVREADRADGVRSVLVVLVFRDGGGVDVEADNATWPPEPAGPGPTTPEQKKALTRSTVTRTSPLYDAQSLTELALAVEDARP